MAIKETSTRFSLRYSCLTGQCRPISPKSAAGFGETRLHYAIAPLSAGLSPLGRLHYAISLVLALLSASPLRADGLEKALLKQAPQIVKNLQQKGYKNVGVLKFRVKKGNEPLSDSVGTLNMFLAHRLEVALTLANDNDVQKQLGIIKGASATASRLAGANHTTQAGRQKLFDGRYRLAWGNQEVSADAFVTGVVLITPDLKEAQIGILYFDKTSEKLDKIVPTFTAPLDGQNLNELGESFVLRGVFDQGKIELAPAQLELAQAKIVETAAKVKTGAEKHPLQDPTAPVALEVLYDNRPIAFEFQEGQALIKEPQQGQKVTFTLRRKNKDDKARYAIVLKVNGENTLFRQKSRDIDCRKWVLEPAASPIVIRGFQKDDQQAEEFRVLAQEESKQRELDYGEEVGLISLAVFGEEKGDALPPGGSLTNEGEDLAAMLRGTFPADKDGKGPANLAALKYQLHADALRALIVEGQQTDQAIRKVEFKPAPLPVMSASIRYYKP